MTDIKHTDLVEAFLAQLKSRINVDRAAFRGVADSAWLAAHADSSIDNRIAASSAAEKVALDTTFATYAVYEIIGHETLAAQGKPLVFLPTFGIKSIEQLKEVVK